MPDVDEPIDGRAEGDGDAYERLDRPGKLPGGLEVSEALKRNAGACSEFFLGDFLGAEPLAEASDVEREPAFGAPLVAPRWGCCMHM